jgi:hypothetical protein
MATHLTDEIHAVSRGELLNPRDNIIGAGIQCDLRTHRPGEIQALCIVVARDHQRSTRGVRYSHCKATDRTAAKNQHRAARHTRLQHRVHGIAHRIHDGADFSGYPVQLHDIRDRHGDEVGECSVPIYPDDLRPPAEVGITEAAL